MPPLDASNLGQIIGRLLNGESIDAEGKVETPPPSQNKRKPRMTARRLELLKLVEERGRITVYDLAAAMNVSKENASMMLLFAWRSELVVRSGTGGIYEYSLPKAE